MVPLWYPLVVNQRMKRLGLKIPTSLDLCVLCQTSTRNQLTHSLMMVSSVMSSLHLEQQPNLQFLKIAAVQLSLCQTSTDNKKKWKYLLSIIKNHLRNPSGLPKLNLPLQKDHLLSQQLLLSLLSPVEPKRLIKMHLTQQPFRAI